MCRNRYSAKRDRKEIRDIKGMEACVRWDQWPCSDLRDLAIVCVCDSGRWCADCRLLINIMTKLVLDAKIRVACACWHCQFNGNHQGCTLKVDAL